MGKGAAVEGAGLLLSLRRWAVLAIASALIFVVYLMQYQVSALAYLLMPRFWLDAVDLSNLMFAPMMLAAVAGIPLGALADRFGVRRVVGTCLVVSVAGAGLRVFADSYAVLLVASLLVGFAPAALNATVIRLLGAWFGSRTSFAIGVYYACSGLGASAAMLTSAVVADATVAFGVAAAALLVVLVLWWCAVKDAPLADADSAGDAGNAGEGGAGSAGAGSAGEGGIGEGGAGERCSEESAQADARISRHADADAAADRGVRANENVALGGSDSMHRYLGVAARERAVWWIAIITGLGLAAKTAYLGFMPQALTAAVSAQEANVLASFVTYGGVAGCAFGPLICARRTHPKAFVVGCAFVSAALMALTAFMLETPSALLLFAAGMASSITAPIVEAIPCALPSLRSCVGSAGGIIGTTSLAMSYVIPVAIAAASGESYAMMVALTGACFLCAVPFLLLLPGLAPKKAKEPGSMRG